MLKYSKYCRTRTKLHKIGMYIKNRKTKGNCKINMGWKV